jgi:hypothetical protein
MDAKKYSEFVRDLDIVDVHWNEILEQTDFARSCKR